MTNFPASAPSGDGAKKCENSSNCPTPLPLKNSPKKSRSKCETLKQTRLPQMVWLSPSINFEIWGSVVSEKRVAVWCQPAGGCSAKHNR